MANKRRKDAVQAPRQMTRGQLSRHQRELQRTRRFYLAMAGVGVLIVLVLLTAVVSQYVIRPNIEVGKVNDQTITRAMYNKYRAWQIFNQLRVLEFYAQQGDATQAQQYASQITTYQNELQHLDGWPTIDPTTLQQLADNLLLEQKAGADLGVSVSDADVLAAAQKNFEPQPTPIPGPTETPGTPTATATTTPTGAPPTATATATGTPPTETPTVTPTATHTATPGPSPTTTSTPTITSTPLPVPGAEKTAVVDYNSFIQAIAAGPAPATGYCSLGCPSLSEQDYLTLVVKPDELQKKVTEKLAANIPTTQEEVHVQHILVNADQEALAKDIKAQLDKGADFAALAAKYSTDTSNKDQGGDLGWFAPTEKGGPMVKEFSDAAFALTKPGQISDPVKSQFGWHIIRLIERGPRPLTSDELDKAKSDAYNAWLSDEKAKSTIRLDIPATPTPFPTQAPLPTEPPAATTATVPLTGTVGTAETPAAGTTPATTPASDTTGATATAVPGSPGATPTQ
jgi:parvulin-like peptidyl-prolyl isomerase